MPTTPIRATLALLAALPLGTAVAAAGPVRPAEEPSISDLARGWTRPLSPLPARADQTFGALSRLDALAALAAGHAPQRCASPLLIALHQHESRLNASTKRLRERAVAVPQGLNATLASPGHEFLIHYTTDPASSDRVSGVDLDLSGVPDGVERIAGEFSDILADVVHEAAWPPVPVGAPPAAQRGPAAVDVFLIGLGEARGGRLDGFTRPLAPAGSDRDDAPDGTAAALFLDASLASPQAASRPALAHQIAHMVQLSESARESIWWHEASATWLENRLEDTADATASALRGRGLRRGRGIEQDSLTLGLEAFLWPHYLVRSTGSDASLVRRLWEEMAAVPGNNTLDAMDQVLRRTLQSSLADEIRLFNIWNLFLGSADDGRHYPFASLLPTPAEDAAYDVFPARCASPGGPLFPMGSALVSLLGDGSDGGLRIRFEGTEAGRWDLSLLVHPVANPADVRHVAVEVDEQGRAEISVPWSDLAGVDLLVQNLAPSGAPADYSCAITQDSRVPFDLLGFTASATDEGVSLAWSTEDEQRLAGWNVYRGAGPLGPFSRLNPWLVPGGGLGDHTLGYVYVDSTTQPGRKYYYRVEGITFEGFSRTSHTAGVRTAPRGASPR